MLSKNYVDGQLQQKAKVAFIGSEKVEKRTRVVVVMSCTVHHHSPPDVYAEFVKEKKRKEGGLRIVDLV
jgi:hypothetical protein